jgi:hypothetical protein
MKKFFDQFYAYNEKELIKEVILRRKPLNREGSVKSSESFFNPLDPLQRVYEMIREYILTFPCSSERLAEKYGYSTFTLFTGVKRFLRLGMAGLVKKYSGVIKTRGISPEKQVAIIRLWYQNVRDVDVIQRKTGVKKSSVYYILDKFRLRELSLRTKKLQSYITPPKERKAPEEGRFKFNSIYHISHSPGKFHA